MHKIDTPGHANNQFINEDANNAIAGTEIGADWLNAIQDEIINVLVAADIDPDKATNNQLAQAIGAIVSALDVGITEQQLANAINRIDLSDKADLNGDATQTFSGADATQAQHFITKAQFDSSQSIGKYATSTGAYSTSSLTAYKDTAGSYSFTPEFTGSIEVTLAAASGGFGWGYSAPNTNVHRGGTTSFGTQTLAGAGGGYGASEHTQASGGGGYVQAAGNSNADGGLGSGFDGVAGDGESIIREGRRIANGGVGQNPRKFTVNVVSGTTYFGVVGVKGLNARDDITGGGPGAVRIQRVS